MCWFLSIVKRSFVLHTVACTSCVCLTHIILHVLSLSIMRRPLSQGWVLVYYKHCSIQQCINWEFLRSQIEVGTYTQSPWEIVGVKPEISPTRLGLKKRPCRKFLPAFCTVGTRSKMKLDLAQSLWVLQLATGTINTPTGSSAILPHPQLTVSKGHCFLVCFDSTHISCGNYSCQVLCDIVVFSLRVINWILMLQANMKTEFVLATVLAFWRVFVFQNYHNTALLNFFLSFLHYFAFLQWHSTST